MITIVIMLNIVAVLVEVKSCSNTLVQIDKNYYSPMPRNEKKQLFQFKENYLFLLSLSAQLQSEPNTRNSKMLRIIKTVRRQKTCWNDCFDPVHAVIFTN